MGMYFVVDGHRVSYSGGLAEFHKYNVLIRVAAEEFTYDWVRKMDYKLSLLKGVL